MDGKDKGYDAFELFEEILNEESVGGQEASFGAEQAWSAEKIHRKERSASADAVEFAEDMAEETVGFTEVMSDEL